MGLLVCPTCGREVSYQRREEVPNRPFCSERCRLIDLGKWLNGEYRVSEPLEEADGGPAGGGEGGEGES